MPTKFGRIVAARARVRIAGVPGGGGRVFGSGKGTRFGPDHGSVSGHLERRTLLYETAGNGRIPFQTERLKSACVGLIIVATLFVIGYLMVKCSIQAPPRPKLRLGMIPPTGRRFGIKAWNYPY
jgi:hypothetical protein